MLDYSLNVQFVFFKYRLFDVIIALYFTFPGITLIDQLFFSFVIVFTLTPLSSVRDTRHFNKPESGTDELFFTYVTRTVTLSENTLLFIMPNEVEPAKTPSALEVSALRWNTISLIGQLNTYVNDSQGVDSINVVIGKLQESFGHYQEVYLQRQETLEGNEAVGAAAIYSSVESDFTDIVAAAMDHINTIKKGDKPALRESDVTGELKRDFGDMKESQRQTG